MTREQRKLAIAVTFLVLALAILGTQVATRVKGRPGSGASGTAPAAAMMDDASSSVPQVGAVAWTPPPEGLAAVLAENPFLRPASAAAVAVSRKRAAPGATVPEFSVRGIRTGDDPAAIINDRTVREGEDVAGWRVVSIETARVTLRKSDGKTIRLAAE